MEQNRWKSSEVARLRNAVANYKLRHGDNLIVWNDVRVESGLTRFTALKVRQKYFNISRGDKGDPTVSDPAKRHGIRVQGTQSGVQGSQNGVQGTQHGDRGIQSRLQATQSRVPGTPTRVQGTQRGAEPAQSGVQGTKSGDRGTQIGIRGAQSKVQGSQSKVHGTQSEVYGTQSEVHGTQSEVHGTQSEVHGTQSEVHVSQIGAHGNQRAIPEPDIRIRQSDVQPEQCSSAEINRTAIAALKVGARTAAGVEFRNYLGFDGGPKKTPKLYMDRLKEALKDGRLDPNWLADPAEKMTVANDWGRQERRDVAKLRNDEVVVVVEEVTPENVSEQLHRQTSSRSTQTNTKNNKALPENLPEKNKWAKDGGSQQRVTVGLSKSLEPEVARATENRRLPVSMSFEVQQPPPKTRNTDHSLFDDAIIGPYGVLLPTPTGFASNHVFRNFTDNEWRKIILEIKGSGFNVLSDEYCWKKLAQKAGITCSLGGLEIQLNFCKYAIPRLEELMACLLDVTPGLEQEITEPNRCTDIFIFHSLKILQFDQIMVTLRTLSNLKCISVEKTPLSAWSTCFISNVLQKTEGYFRCQAEDLQNLREDVIKMTLRHCNAKSNGK